MTNNLKMSIAISPLSLATLVITLVSLFGCEGQLGENRGIDSPSTISSSDEQVPSEQELSLEINLSTEEREAHRSVLLGLYQELTSLSTNQSAETAQAQRSDDPMENCDRCGRETGFLPAPDLYLNRFVPVEMKALTFGLASWEVDELQIEDALEELTGTTQQSAELSFLLSLVRVDLDSMTEANRELARDGQLIELGEINEITTTSVTTSAQELGITFEHGYAYIMYISLTEGISKLHSLPSQPVMVYCGTEHGEHGGCVQLR